MKKYDVTQPVVLKKGVYQLNDESNFNYQLNRVINWDGGRLEDVITVAGKIHNSSDWKRAMITLGNRAMKEGRTENVIAYYRMSEFFMYDGDPGSMVGRSVQNIFRSCSKIRFRKFLTLLWIFNLIRGKI